MNLRKLLTNQNTPNYAKKVFTGKVRFVHRGKIKTGEVFGKPYTHTGILVPKTFYNIVDGENVYEIQEEYIEEIKEET